MSTSQYDKPEKHLVNFYITVCENLPIVLLEIIASYAVSHPVVVVEVSAFHNQFYCHNINSTKAFVNDTILCWLDATCNVCAFDPNNCNPQLYNMDIISNHARLIFYESISKMKNISHSSEIHVLDDRLFLIQFFSNRSTMLVYEPSTSLWYKDTDTAAISQNLYKGVKLIALGRVLYAFYPMGDCYSFDLHLHVWRYISFYQSHESYLQVYPLVLPNDVIILFNITTLYTGTLKIIYQDTRVNNSDRLYITWNLPIKLYSNTTLNNKWIDPFSGRLYIVLHDTMPNGTHRTFILSRSLQHQISSSSSFFSCCLFPSLVSSYFCKSDQDHDFLTCSSKDEWTIIASSCDSHMASISLPYGKFTALLTTSLPFDTNNCKSYNSNKDNNDDNADKSRD